MKQLYKLLFTALTITLLYGCMEEGETASNYSNIPSQVPSAYDISANSITFRYTEDSYDRLMMSTTSNMDNAIEHPTGGTITFDKLRPDTYYYFVHTGWDGFGGKVMSDVQGYQTSNYDMYVESNYTTSSSIVFNAGTVVYEKLLLSDRQDMSNIVLEGPYYKRTTISGLQSYTTYYLQTEATDFEGKTYRSPVITFRTSLY